MAATNGNSVRARRHGGPIDIEKSRQHEARIAVVRGASLVESHLPVERVIPRGPRPQLSQRIETRRMSGDHDRLRLRIILVTHLTPPRLCPYKITARTRSSIMFPRRVRPLAASDKLAAQ